MATKTQVKIGDRYIHKGTRETVEVMRIEGACVIVKPIDGFIRELMMTEVFVQQFVPASEAGIDYWRGTHE